MCPLLEAITYRRKSKIISHLNHFSSQKLFYWSQRHMTILPSLWLSRLLFCHTSVCARKTKYCARIVSKHIYCFFSFCCFCFLFCILTEFVCHTFFSLFKIINTKTRFNARSHSPSHILKLIPSIRSTRHMVAIKVIKHLRKWVASGGNLLSHLSLDSRALESRR